MTRLEAVIEIGTSAARLLVAEISGPDSWKVIDQSELPVQLGRDVFAAGGEPCLSAAVSGSVSRESLLQCLTILRRFREQLAGWNIGDGHITAVATSAIREAANRDAVLDRILVKTGFPVTVIDGIEESRLMYLAVSDCLKHGGADFFEAPSIIIEVGGGSTDLLMIEKKKIQAAHSFRLGTVVVSEAVKSMAGNLNDTRQFLREFVGKSRVLLNAEVNLNKIQHFIALGQDPRFVADQIGISVGSGGLPGFNPHDRVHEIDRARFNEFLSVLAEYSGEECVARYKIPYGEAQFLHTGLMTYQMFLELTGARTILVPATNIREGIIIDKITREAAGTGSALMDEFTGQIVASAKSLARKYLTDEAHSAHVGVLALKLFDSLKFELGLDIATRRLLEISAVLHDIGMFINGSEHHIHSAYIVAHSEIFGLTRDEKRLITKIVLLHRGRYTPNRDSDWTVLPQADRMLILKLAAILRIADALDRDHRQRIRNFSVDFRKDTVVIRVREKKDWTLEKIAVAKKADMFEAVFGNRVVLE
ncbi:MAG: HD domain-containing protein [Spirochaetaceae bacterium]|jgi:exopolyphosphatase/guanosine-5'-triphosphate,3'-diphosphate pyrophosphatase|nr:HD domain-containing protein [Spirochaetaceae bacterium]